MTDSALKRAKHFQARMLAGGLNAAEALAVAAVSVVEVEAIEAVPYDGCWTMPVGFHPLYGSVIPFGPADAAIEGAFGGSFKRVAKGYAYVGTDRRPLGPNGPRLLDVAIKGRYGYLLDEVSLGVTQMLGRFTGLSGHRTRPQWPLTWPELERMFRRAPNPFDQCQRAAAYLLKDGSNSASFEHGDHDAEFYLAVMQAGNEVGGAKYFDVGTTALAKKLGGLRGIIHALRGLHVAGSG